MWLMTKSEQQNHLIKLINQPIMKESVTMHSWKKNAFCNNISISYSYTNCSMLLSFLCEYLIKYVS